jgi:hypothetical protein
VVKLPWAADCCPCVEKLRGVLPRTVGRDGAVQVGGVYLQRGARGMLHQRPRRLDVFELHGGGGAVAPLRFAVLGSRTDEPRAPAKLTGLR